MKTEEKIKNAKTRIAELERLIQFWEQLENIERYLPKTKITNGN